jgi:hypothetical protein
MNTELGPDQLACAEDRRREALRGQSQWQGIDYLEVDEDDPRKLAVHLIANPDSEAFAGLLAEAPAVVTVMGGIRVRGIAVTAVQAIQNGIEVTLAGRGDLSTYTLKIKHARMDPAYDEVDFSFAAGCDARFDCAPRERCPEPVRDQPAIDYMAKDYASFRRALLDFLAGRVPGFAEEHAADLSVTLVELLAYVGDLISWEQDAVATEAFLETARRRESVRRHARLVDYRLHDGAGARTWIHLGTPKHDGPGDDQPLGTVPAGTKVLTGLTVPVGKASPPHPPVIAAKTPDAGAAACAGAAAVFETVEERLIVPRLSRLPIHTWGDAECCLPVGATEADLAADVAFVAGDAEREAEWRLRPGSDLLFEQVRGVATGLEVDAERSHRQVVTLTAASSTKDELLGVELTHVEWSHEDALTFPLCVSTSERPGALAREIAVARGNLVLADHGRSLPVEHHPEPPATGIEVGPRPFRLSLREGPLAQRVRRRKGEPATRLRERPDPARAVPEVELELHGEGIAASTWSPARDGLFASDGFDQHFAVETDDDGRATLRFGDGIYGAAPPSGAQIEARYRIGVGNDGNVGQDSLVHLLEEGIELPRLEVVRNPLPASGGIDPEPVERVKQIAPDAFRAKPMRAVNEADYGEVAELHPRVSRARATLRWTGTWHTVFLAIDPRGGGRLSARDREALLEWVARFTQAGYDLELESPRYVPLAIELQVCAAAGWIRTDVERAVLDALGSGRGGFFHPDRFSFGEPLYLSQLVAAVEAVVGVDSVTPLRFSRLYDDDPEPDRPATADHLERGSIEAERLEVLQLENDPSRPERGVLSLQMGGGI